jgi:AcrR family transcriptional regulator
MTTTDTKAKLVAAAQAAIREGGTEAATARRITGRAGANLASIPYHFGSKDELIAEALVTDARRMIGPALDALGSDGDPRARALAAVQLLNERFAEEREWVPVLLAALARAPHSEPVAEGLQGLWNELRELLAADIAAQRAGGLVAHWVDPAAMAGLILAVVLGVMAASVVDPDGPDHIAVSGQLVGLLLAAATERSR